MERIIDYKDGKVLIAGTAIGTLDAKPVRKLLKDSEINLWTERMREQVYGFETDYTACPICGAKQYHWFCKVGKVKIGYCLECRTSLYEHAGKVSSQIGNRTGYKRFVRKLKL
jgi:hypothetical protein